MSNQTKQFEKKNKEKHNDYFWGGEGDDQLLDNQGDDLHFGRGGNDSLSGSDGNDILLGSTGNDDIDGGADNDQLFGEGDNDNNRGGRGEDSLWDRELNASLNLAMAVSKSSAPLTRFALALRSKRPWQPVDWITPTLPGVKQE